MTKYDKAIKELQTLLLSKELEDIPYVLENKIVIGNFLIKPANHGDYWLIDRRNHTKELFYNKLSAIAAAKNHNMLNVKNEIRKLDKLLTKHSNDSIFYKHTIKKSKNSVRRESVQNRLDISNFYSRSAKQKLYNFIIQR
jgi:hypothetical protein